MIDGIYRSLNMQDIVEIARDDLKKYVIYWQYDAELKNWKLYLKYQQDNVVKKWFSLLRRPSPVVTTSVYGKVEVDKMNPSKYVALIPRDTNFSLKGGSLRINTVNDADSYVVIGCFETIKLAMQAVFNKNNPFGSSNTHIHDSSVEGSLERR